MYHLNCYQLKLNMPSDYIKKESLLNEIAANKETFSFLFKFMFSVYYVINN